MTDNRRWDGGDASRIEALQARRTAVFPWFVLVCFLMAFSAFAGYVFGQAL